MLAQSMVTIVFKTPVGMETRQQLGEETAVRQRLGLSGKWTEGPAGLARWEAGLFGQTDIVYSPNSIPHHFISKTLSVWAKRGH